MAIYSESKAVLEKKGVRYIMPNQALAVALCEHEEAVQKNVLLKVGTGQGKSIIIAATALREARRLEPGQYVFVLTAYNHLASRDQKMGQDFFTPHDIASIHLAKLPDLDRLTDSTKIIYADAKELQGVAQHAMAEQIQVLAKPAEASAQISRRLDFLRRLYTERHRFILDEYDLILHDLDLHKGFVTTFGPEVITKSFIDNENNKKFSPSLAGITEPSINTTTSSTDVADGKSATQVSSAWVKGAGCSTSFELRAGALRMSKLLSKASRIIGLSGSSENDDVKSIKGLEGLSVQYYEVPSSRDPDVFGTRVVQGPRELLGGRPGIWRAQEPLECSDEGEYISAIVDDVRKARERRSIPGAENQTVVRPVLIFVDPNHSRRCAGLIDALRPFEPPGGLRKILTEGDLRAETMDRIGAPGEITISSILCGRGADIIVSPNVPDSLHVVVATNVPSRRLLTQLIGRTGRMGRDGSHSIITMNPCVAPRSICDLRDRENLLHEHSTDLVRLLVEKKCDIDKARRWLMLGSELVWGPDNYDKKAIESSRKEFELV